MPQKTYEIYAKHIFRNHFHAFLRINNDMGFMGLNLFNSLENNDFVMVATGTNLFSNEISKIFLN